MKTSGATGIYMPNLRPDIVLKESLAERSSLIIDNKRRHLHQKRQQVKGSVDKSWFKGILFVNCPNEVFFQVFRLSVQKRDTDVSLLKSTDIISTSTIDP